MKIIPILLIAVATLGISMRVVFVKGPGSLSIHHKDSKEVMEYGQGHPKQALIIYQPAGSGSTKKVVESMAKVIKGTGYDVEMNVPGDFLPTDLSRYDLVAFGSPVYAGQISPVLTDYMKSVARLPKGRVLVFAVGGVMDKTLELDTLKAALPDSPLCLALKFNYKEDAKNAESYKKLKDLASE